VATPQNKFEILSSRVMQYGMEGRIVKSIRMAAVKYFRYGEEGHKCRECPLWRKKEDGKDSTPRTEKSILIGEVSQTLFGHISTNSLIILTVSIATESP